MWESRRLRLREVIPQVDARTYRAIVRYVELETNMDETLNVGFTRFSPVGV